MSDFRVILAKLNRNGFLNWEALAAYTSVNRKIQKANPAMARRAIKAKLSAKGVEEETEA